VFARKDALWLTEAN